MAGNATVPESWEHVVSYRFRALITALVATLVLAAPGLTAGAQAARSAPGAAHHGVASSSTRGDSAGGPGAAGRHRAAPAVSITTASALPHARVGTAYRKALAATGGGPYTWSVTTGTLPAGLTLSTAGVISGTPSAGGSATFTVKVVGAGGASASKSFVLVVDTVWILTNALPSGSVGRPYAATLVAGGAGPFTWAVAAGALPAGLTLNGATGTISGTPTKAATTSVTLKVTGAGATTAQKAYSGKVLAATALAITTTSLPNGTIGTAYTTTVQATGTGTASWTISAGKLPTGLTLGKSTGVISGTPTAAGTANVTIKLVRGTLTTTQPLTLTVAASSGAVTITTTSLPNGQVGVAYAATLTGTGPGPYTWSLASGTLPAGLSLAPATGAISGTPTTAGTVSFTVKLVGAAGASATKALSITVAAAATSEDWTQPGHDAGRTAWSAGETMISPAQAASVHEETTVQPGVSAIAGGTLYVVGPVPADSAATELTTYDPATWTQQSSFVLPGFNSCTYPQLLVSSALLIVNCSTELIAIDRTAPHSLVWRTSDTDPGSAFQDIALSGSSIVVYGGDRVATYRLSDGQRLWQQLMPSGATLIRGVATGGNTVVVGYDDRLRGLSLTTGAQLWVISGVDAWSLVASTDGYVYANVGGNLARYNLATGAAGWRLNTLTDINQVVGVDGDTVYAWEMVVDEFGDLITSRLHALRTSDGTERWAHDIDSRVEGAGITGGVIWLDMSWRYSEGRATDLLALNRTTGAQLADLAYADNSYGVQPAFGDGLVALTIGGSSTAFPQERTHVFGLAPATPDIVTTVLPLARVGVTYEADLTAAGGTGPYTWSVTNGTLPGGLSLSAAGHLSGTPTALGSARLTVRVTDSRGTTRSVSLTLAVVGGSPSWTTHRNGADLNPFNPAETAIDLSTSPMLGYRYSFAKSAGTTVNTNYSDVPVIIGTRAYVVRADGTMAAWDTAGTTTNRAPLWVTKADPANVEAYFSSPVAAGGNTLVAVDYSGAVVAVRATDGVILWRSVDGLSYIANEGQAPVVSGSRVYTVGAGGAVSALDLATGSVLWTRDLMTSGSSSLYGPSTDGTHVYLWAQCTVYSLDAATGATTWTQSIPGSDPAACWDPSADGAPMVIDGVVYAVSAYSIGALRASDGSVIWSAPVRPHGVTSVVGGVWLVPAVDRLVAFDARSGAELWATPIDMARWNISVSGDLIIAMEWNLDSHLYGFDRTTGELVWDGGVLDPAEGLALGGPAISGGHIYVNTDGSGIRVFGLP